MRPIVALAVTTCLGVAFFVGDRASAAELFRYRGEISIPTAGADALYAAGGEPGCNIWFTERAANKIGCVESLSTIREFALPTAHAEPVGIVQTANGDAWFTEFGARKIGRVSVQGQITEVAAPAMLGNPINIVGGPLGAYWFSGELDHRVGWVDPKTSRSEAGAIDLSVWGLASFPNAPYVWFIERDGSRIGRLDSELHVATYMLGAMGGNSLESPSDFVGPAITLGEGKTVWFTEPYVPQLGGAAIGYMTADGGVKLFPTPTKNCGPAALLWDGDGVWFTEYRASKIGHVDEAGHFEELATHTPNAGPVGIARDAFRTILVVERNANKIEWFSNWGGSLVRSRGHRR